MSVPLMFVILGSLMFVASLIMHFYPNNEINHLQEINKLVNKLEKEEIRTYYLNQQINSLKEKTNG
jgi:hypothetical protein